MHRQSIFDRQAQPLLEKVLAALQDPSYNKDSFTDELIGALIKTIPFFRINLDKSIRLQDFIQLAKFDFHYETYPYGSVLIKEKECPDRLSIVLRGDVAKIAQKTYNELEKDLKNQEARNSQVSLLENSITSSPTNKSPRSVRSVFFAFKAVSMLNSLKNPIKINRGKTLSSVPAEFANKNDDALTPKVPSIAIAEAQEDFEPPAPLTTTSKLSLKFAPECFFPTELDFTTPVHAPGARRKALVRRVHSQAFKEENLAMSRKESLVLPADKNSKLIEDISERHACLKERFYTGNVVRVSVVRTYSAGHSFGESIAKQHQPKENSVYAVASEDVHLLTISRDSFRKIVSELFRRTYDKAEFFQDLFPALNNDLVKTFSGYFVERHFNKGELIYMENEPVEALYILKDGDIVLTKETQQSSSSSPRLGPVKASHSPMTSPRSTRKIELPIANLVKGQFFGEELILDKHEREYSAVSKSPNTVVYLVDSQSYGKIEKRFGDILKSLADQAQERFKWREQRVLALVEKQNSALKKPKLPLFSNVPLKLNSEEITKVGTVTWRDTLSTRTTTRETQAQQHTDPEEAVNDQVSCLRIKSLSSILGDDKPVKPTNSEVYKNKFSRKMPGMPRLDMSPTNLGKDKVRGGSMDKNMEIEDLFSFSERKPQKAKTQSGQKPSVPLDPRLLKTLQMFRSKNLAKSKTLEGLPSPKKSNKKKHEATMLVTCYSWINNGGTAKSPQSKTLKSLTFRSDDSS